MLAYHLHGFQVHSALHRNDGKGSFGGKGGGKGEGGRLVIDSVCAFTLEYVARQTFKLLS